jgi:multisubunit Na+/H+ antiporter MnhF subunit
MLRFIFISLLLLTIILLILIFTRKRNITIFLIVNTITSKVTALIVVVSLFFKQYYLIDISFIYILLGCGVPWVVLNYYKYIDKDFVIKKRQ